MTLVTATTGFVVAAGGAAVGPVDGADEEGDAGSPGVAVAGAVASAAGRLPAGVPDGDGSEDGVDPAVTRAPAAEPAEVGPTAAYVTPAPTTTTADTIQTIVDLRVIAPAPCVPHRSTLATSPERRRSSHGNVSHWRPDIPRSGGVS
ncbi:hypothetical protein GCM10022256_09680 [Frondihabitans peucedani]|uniref:Uncharacterized protein n=1 Tax=Frondihabitans peucedani TaxID=598626 RepID=A0ABP8DZL1_9MICO